MTGPYIVNATHPDFNPDDPRHDQRTPEVRAFHALLARVDKLEEEARKVAKYVHALEEWCDEVDRKLGIRE